MPKYCYVKTCKPHHFNTSGISFHRLPSNDPDLLRKWLDNLGPTFPKSASGQICSRHFEDIFLDKTGQITRLRPFAYPTLFLNQEINGKELYETPRRLVFKKPRNLLQEYDIEPDLSSISHDHSYSSQPYVRPEVDYKVKYLACKKELEIVRKQLKMAKQKLKRREGKIDSFKTLMSKLKEKNFISNDTDRLLDNVLEGIPRELFGRYIKKNLDKKISKTYPAEVRRFALTLNFLSPKGYNYVRETLNNCLPHPSTLTRWYANINGQPGICTESIVALKRLKEANKDIVIALMMDEMSIRKHIDFDGNKNIGFVDFGISDENDNEQPVASQALVYLAVSLNSSWKVPVAYYFINCLTADEKAGITSIVLEHLKQAQIDVASITCDGLATNISMAQSLGVSFNINNFDMTLKENNGIYFMLDACHNIKLMRNAFFDYKIFLDGSGNEINIKYIWELFALQEKEGLRLANRLTSAHMQWKKQPMKVRFAVETLSASVADAIDFCRNELKLAAFRNSEYTTKFIRLCDRVFDIANAKNIFGKNFKSPLKRLNENYWRPYLEESFKYLSKIKLCDGKLAIYSARKTPFLGFLSNIKSIIGIFDRFVNNECPKLKYFLPYKCSQDHLELFFSSIRSRGGFNNNPSAKQFKAAFKRLLIHHELKHTASNCLALDNSSILNVSSLITDKTIIEHRKNNSIGINYDYEHDYADIFSPSLSKYIENVVEYISGYVVRKLINILDCSVCCKELIDERNPKFDFISFKNKGGLVVPSEKVVLLCKKAEVFCKRFLLSNENKPTSMDNILNRLVDTVFASLPRNIFDKFMNSHIFDSDTWEQSHNLCLIKKIIAGYVKIRLHHINNMYNLKLKGASIRQRFNKIVLFKGQ